VLPLAVIMFEKGQVHWVAGSDAGGPNNVTCGPRPSAPLSTRLASGIHGPAPILLFNFSNTLVLHTRVRSLVEFLLLVQPPCPVPTGNRGYNTARQLSYDSHMTALPIAIATRHIQSRRTMAIG
jgi:hypothetical protein